LNSSDIMFSYGPYNTYNYVYTNNGQKMIYNQYEEYKGQMNQSFQNYYNGSEKNLKLTSGEKHTFMNDQKGDETQQINEKTKKLLIPGNSGIYNMGNTCYMNSAIQALSHLYPLRIFLFENKEKIINIILGNASKILESIKTSQVIPIELKNKLRSENFKISLLDEKEKLFILNNTMTIQLIHLLENLWKENNTIYPLSFRKIFSEVRKKFFAGFEQQDAEEAYSCIVQQIQEELKENVKIHFNNKLSSIQVYKYFVDEMKTKDPTQKNYHAEKRQLKKDMWKEYLTNKAYREIENYLQKNYSKVMEFFTGFLHSCIQCPHCQYSSNKFDPFTHISLPVINKSSVNLMDCLKEFCKEEILDDNNLWSCKECKKKVRAHKKMQLWSLPGILVIQLKRFDQNRINKITNLINFPLENLDLKNMISPFNLDPSLCYEYTLYCVINHQGTLHQGHYYAFCRKENKWYSFNDDYIDEVSEENIISHNAYTLFYIRNDFHHLLG
jgi:ubiquitin C-terminal hydrolase